MTVLAVFGGFALFAGMAISLLVLRQRGSELAPRGPTLRPRYWRPVWKAQDWFTSTAGFRLYVFGAQLIGLGALMIAVFFLSRLF